MIRLYQNCQLDNIVVSFGICATGKQGVFNFLGKEKMSICVINKILQKLCYGTII